MSNRLLPTIIALATMIAAVAVALVSPLAFAEQDGFRSLNNEAGSEFVGMPSSVARDQVKRDRDAARRDGSLGVYHRSAGLPEGAPRAGFTSSREEVREAARLRDQKSSGWRYVGGEVGWVYEGR